MPVVDEPPGRGSEAHPAEEMSGPEEMQQVLIEIENEDLEYARALAAENGVSLEHEEGFLDGVSLVVVLAGGALAVASVHTLLERRRGGQMIDLRPNAERFAWRDKGLQYGLIVIRTPDGQVAIDVWEPEGMFGQVLEALRGMVTDLVGASSTTVEQRVHEGLAGKATITGAPRQG